MEMHHMQQQELSLAFPSHQQQLPKGRGRPRASYAQTGEFDLGLIREFRSRPALYDRANKRFKDKPYVAQQWMQISNKLGYDVTILRERMITLRNRYNIEKRRVENGLTTVSSQWPLFETLHFLADHIRTRRSFKNLNKHEDDEEPYELDEFHSDSNGQVTSIKDELEQEYDEYDCEQQLPVTTVLSIPHSAETYSSSSRTPHNGCDLNGSKHQPNTSSVTRRQQEVISASLKPKRSVTADAEEPAAKRRLENLATAATTTNTTSTAYAKFHGFGEFMTHSLTELPLPTALRLVQKFTRELVQTTIRCQGNNQAKQDQVDQLSSELEEDD